LLEITPSAFRRIDIHTARMVSSRLCEFSISVHFLYLICMRIGVVYLFANSKFSGGYNFELRSNGSSSDCSRDTELLGGDAREGVLCLTGGEELQRLF
jgi:hypothetical protein